jgi:hypothetical protein
MAPAGSASPVPGAVSPGVAIGTPGSPPSPAASSHCVDLAAAGECVQGSAWPVPPAPVVTASELGEGFGFASLNGSVALAHGVPHPKAVVIEPSGTQSIELFEGDGSEPWVAVDALYGARFASNRLMVLGCRTSAVGAQRSCELFTSARDADTSVFQPLARLEALDAAWAPAGLVDLWEHEPDDDHEVCVYGSGIQCRNMDGTWDLVLSSDHGRIVAVTSGASVLALTESGTLLAARADSSGSSFDRWDWHEVPASAPLTRLSEAGAFDDQGLWVQRVGGTFQECNQQPMLLAGDGWSDALDENGTPYSRQPSPPDDRYRLCKWPSVMPGPVLGEAHLTCGIARNWVVMTNEAVFSMAGGLFCAID